MNDFSSLYWIHREKPEDSINTANMKPDSSLWASQELHLFIITDAGKPIYSRYGTVQILSPILCTCVIILEHMKSLNESLNHFTAGNHTFVFLPKKPFIFIAVSKSSLPATFLFKQLNFLYSLFLSLFSEKFISKIAETHSCDFRQYAEGTRSAWDGVVNNMSQDPAFIFAPSIPVAYMRPDLRQQLIHSSSFERLPSCKLAMLMHRNRVLAIGHNNCDTLSLRLIVDLMWTPAFQNEESWTIFFARNSNEQMHHLYFKNHEKSDYRIVMLCSDNQGFDAYHRFAVSMLKDLEENYFEEMSKPLTGAPEVFYFWTLNSITHGQVYMTDPCEKVFGSDSNNNEKNNNNEDNEIKEDHIDTVDIDKGEINEDNFHNDENDNHTNNNNNTETENNTESITDISHANNENNNDNNDTNQNSNNSNTNIINNDNIDNSKSNNTNNKQDGRSNSFEKMQDLYRQLAKCYEMVQTNGIDGEYMFRGDKDVIVVFKNKEMEIYAVAKSEDLTDQMVTEKLNELKNFVNANFTKLIITERRFHVDKFG